MIGWRIPLATICLITGTSFATEPSTAWRTMGGVFLVFVPALIADHVVHVLGGPTHAVKAAQAAARADHSPNYPPAMHANDLLPGRQPGMHSDPWPDTAESEPSGG